MLAGVRGLWARIGYVEAIKLRCWLSIWNCDKIAGVANKMSSLPLITLKSFVDTYQQHCHQCREPSRTRDCDMVNGSPHMIFYCRPFFVLFLHPSHLMLHYLFEIKFVTLSLLDISITLRKSGRMLVMGNKEVKLILNLTIFKHSHSMLKSINVPTNFRMNVWGI